VTIDGRSVEYLDAMRYTQWFNALACPAAVIPVGTSPEGLPIGVQIVSRPFEDEVALGVAAVVDAAFGYRPPRWRERNSGQAVQVYWAQSFASPTECSIGRPGAPARIHLSIEADPNDRSTLRLPRELEAGWSARCARKLAGTLC